MLPDLSDDQLISLCQQRGLALAGSPPITPITPIIPALSHFDSAAHPSPTSHALGLQLHPAASPSLSVSSGPSTQEHAQASHTMAPLNVNVPRRHPLHSSWVPGVVSPGIPARSAPPLRGIPAHRQPQRRAEKRKHHESHSGTEESGVENTHPQISFGANPLLAQVERLREACTALPVPDPNFIVGSVNGGKVQDFSMHLAKRDALIAELVNTLFNVTQELTEWIVVLETDDIPSMKYMHKGGGFVKKRKAQRTILEQRLTDSVKAHVHSVVQRALHWRPGRANQLPSAGATYQDKRADGTYIPVEIMVPEWDTGPRSNENAKWTEVIKQAVKAEIEEDSEDLGHKWKDLKMQPVILEAIDYQIYTYFETLRRQYKNQNNEERAKKKEGTDLRLKRDQRVRGLRSKLTNHEVLKEVNIVVELAAQELDSPSIEIQADDLPFEALSDLESDPEGISVSDQARYQKEAHIDKLASTKWMSRRKIWTSEAFEALKCLFKQVMNSEGGEGLVTQKRAPAALHYTGPVTHREPGFMNVQVWMVDPTLVSNNQMKTCKQNQGGFMSMDEGALLRIFDRAQEISRARKDQPMDGGEGDNEAEM